MAKKKKRDEAGRPGTGQIMTELISFVKEFIFYPEDDRESLKSFKQRDSMTVLRFRGIIKATE